MARKLHHILAGVAVGRYKHSGHRFVEPLFRLTAKAANPAIQGGIARNLLNVLSFGRNEHAARNLSRAGAGDPDDANSAGGLCSRNRRNGGSILFHDSLLLYHKKRLVLRTAFLSFLS